MKKIILFFIANSICFFSFAQNDLTRLVNPFIGTGGHGHTFPGASMPFGMLQLSPDTRLKGWDGCSGYHYSDNSIYGFSHTHLSGTGIEDYCDVLLQPSIGEYKWNNEEYKSSFSHANEKAYPGYYAVKLDKHNIDVELTATLRTGLHRYSFPAGTKEGNVLVDLYHRDIVLDSWMEQVDEYTLRGMRQSRSWANKQTLFFVIKFSKPIKKYTVALNDEVKGGLAKVTGRNIKAYTSFDLSDGKPLLVKVGISGVNAEGAMKNLEAEQPGFDFEATLANAKATWNKELGKIEIEGGSTDEQTVFYTSLYHTCLSPNVYMDVDNHYRGTDDKIHTANGFVNHSVFSLWDTHRAFHPLMTIINQKRTNDWINTFLVQDENGGMLPVWELSANETFCMIGYHSVSVIADAYKKGIRGFDGNKALKAMTRYAEGKRFGLPYYIQNGYLSNDREAESVSKTVEYAYDDWCIAQMAKQLGNKQVYDQYIQRAQNYKNIFDPVTKHMRGKLGGMWYSPFDPREINHFYTEGNSWQYSFTAQQDIAGLIQLYGGKKNFSTKLNELFTTVSQTTGRDQSDVTGLIGQYAQGNEPSHHMVYLFNYINQPWKTQFYIHKILKDFYLNTPDGLIGNEDCGQMSAWYLMSAMGFYAVCPGNGDYVLGTPAFNKVTIHLENGKNFIINANRKSADDFYVQSVNLNGKPQTASYIWHNTIMQGGELSFNLGAEPNYKWGNSDKDVPVTKITEHLITPVPYFEGSDKKFNTQKSVTIKTVDGGSEIYYAISKDGNKASEYKKYTQPIIINETATVYAYSLKNNKKSLLTEQRFFKIPNDKNITVLSKVNSIFTAGGPSALIDGITGDANYRTGEWQSYVGTDFEAIVDLKQVKQINYVGGHFLQDVGSWIWMPKNVIFEYSTDGKSFYSIGEAKNTLTDTDYAPIVQQLGLNTNVKARYIKLKAINYGKIPDWHPGKDGDAHIFIDEVIVK